MDKASRAGFPHHYRFRGCDRCKEKIDETMEAARCSESDAIRKRILGGKDLKPAAPIQPV